MSKVQSHLYHNLRKRRRFVDEFIRQQRILSERKKGDCCVVWVSAPSKNEARTKRERGKYRV